MPAYHPVYTDQPKPCKIIQTLSILAESIGVQLTKLNLRIKTISITVFRQYFSGHGVSLLLSRCPANVTEPTKAGAAQA